MLIGCFSTRGRHFFNQIWICEISTACRNWPVPHAPASYCPPNNHKWLLIQIYQNIKEKQLQWQICSHTHIHLWVIHCHWAHTLSYCNHRIFLQIRRYLISRSGKVERLRQTRMEKKSCHNNWNTDARPSNHSKLQNQQSQQASTSF